MVVVMKTRKQIHQENEWRKRTGHAYAENLEYLPKNKAANARRYFIEHKPYGIGGDKRDDV